MKTILVVLLCSALSAVLAGSGAAVESTEGITVLVAYYSRTGHTKQMAEGVAEGANTVQGTAVVLKRVEEVTAEELFSADALVVGSPVYWANMAGPVKSFFDDWQLKFGVYPDFKMRDKVGAAFTTGGQVSSGKELTLLTMLAAMLGNQMIIVSAGGAFGASATTEGASPGVDAQELSQARLLGKRVALVASMIKRGRRGEPSRIVK